MRHLAPSESELRFLPLTHCHIYLTPWWWWWCARCTNFRFIIPFMHRKCKIHFAPRTQKSLRQKSFTMASLRTKNTIHFLKTMMCLRAFVELIKIVLNFKSVNIHIPLSHIHSSKLIGNHRTVLCDGKQQKCNFNARLIIHNPNNTKGNMWYIVIFW